MKKMTQKFQDSQLLIATMLLLAIAAALHGVILLILTINERNLAYINLFNIFDLNYFFPGIDTSVLSHSVSFLLLLVFYFMCLFVVKKVKKKGI